MDEQEYEIYDIITKQKIDKSQVKPGKSYIINYTKDKWKIRRVVFDENGKIKNEYYIKLEDRQEAIKDTIISILKSKGNTDIQIDYDDAIRLNGIEIKMPVFNVKYKDTQGITRERILDEQSLKDILILDENGNENIVLNNSNIKTMQIGNSKEYSNYNTYNSYDTVGQKEEQTQFEERRNPMTVNWTNVKVTGEVSIAKTNAIFYVNDYAYDLRTDKGVEEFRKYMDLQKEEQNLDH